MVDIFKKTIFGYGARRFWAFFFVAFVITLFILFVFNLVPQGFKDSLSYLFFNNEILQEGVNKNVTPDAINILKEMPTRIVIGKIGTDQPIKNPETASVEILNENLLEGVVRYPESGFLGEDKNIFLFGHSTGLKNVKNPAFTAFNNLDNLAVGDEILLESTRHIYIYRVISVREAKASDIKVSFEEGQSKLTLTTCNVFGEKEDRFIVEALFEVRREI